MKLIFILTLTVVLSLSCGPTKLEPVDIVWTEFSEIQDVFPKAGKQIFLYVSQNACQWCDMMDSTIFPRPEIAHHLNDNYMNVNINLDEDLPVTINGKEYNYAQLFNLFNLKEIPAYYFFDANGNIIGILNSAMHVDTFKQLLMYVQYRHFQRTRWEDFLKLPESQVDTTWGVF